MIRQPSAYDARDDPRSGPVHGSDVATRHRAHAARVRRFSRVSRAERTVRDGPLPGSPGLDGGLRRRLPRAGRGGLGSAATAPGMDAAGARELRERGGRRAQRVPRHRRRVAGVVRVGAHRTRRLGGGDPPVGKSKSGARVRRDARLVSATPDGGDGRPADVGRRRNVPRRGGVAQRVRGVALRTLPA